MRLPGVDVARFQESMTTGGLLGYVDALSGGSISRVGVFSLGAHFQLTFLGLTGSLSRVEDMIHGITLHDLW